MIWNKFFPVLDWYQFFLIPTKFGFHKTIYKRFRFSLYFIKIELIRTMSIIINLKIVIYHLVILTNQPIISLKNNNNHNQNFKNIIDFIPYIYICVK
jgi:hypothetical protein